MKTMIRYAVRAAALIVAVFIVLSLLDYIGNRFGIFWGWVTIIGGLAAFTAYAEHHERNLK